MRIVLLILAIVVLTAGCVSQQTQNRSNQTIKVGFIAPITGHVPECGLSMQIGLDMAMKTNPNANGIEFIVEDDQFNPATSATITRKLIEQDGVKIIVGPCSSSTVLADAPIAESAKVILITPTGFADKISEAGDYIFRAATTASDEAPRVVDFVLNELNTTDIGIIYLNNDFGVSYNNKIKKVLKEKGIEVKISEAADPPTSDFRTVLTKMKNANVKTLILATACCTHPVNIAKQAKELGLNLTYVGASVIEDEQFLLGAGEAAEGFYVLSTIDLSEEHALQNPEISKFVDIFSKEYPTRIPTRDRLQTFIATNMIIDATKICGSDENCIKAWLYDVQNKSTILGPISINELGDVKYSHFVFKQVQNGTFVKVA